VEIVKNNWTAIEDWIFEAYELINNIENERKSKDLTDS